MFIRLAASPVPFGNRIVGLHAIPQVSSVLAPTAFRKDF
jgi:hypothetical protein